MTRFLILIFLTIFPVYISNVAGSESTNQKQTNNFVVENENGPFGFVFGKAQQDNFLKSYDFTQKQCGNQYFANVFMNAIKFDGVLKKPYMMKVYVGNLIDDVLLSDKFFSSELNKLKKLEKQREEKVREIKKLYPQNYSELLNDALLISPDVRDTTFAALLRGWFEEVFDAHLQENLRVTEFELRSYDSDGVAAGSEIYIRCPKTSIKITESALAEFFGWIKAERIYTTQYKGGLVGVQLNFSSFRNEEARQMLSEGGYEYVGERKKPGFAGGDKVVFRKGRIFAFFKEGDAMSTGYTGRSHIDFVSWGHALRMGLEPLEKYKDPKIDKNLDELLKKEIKSPF